MNKKMVMGAIIVFLMISSVFGFIIGYQSDSGVTTTKYNGIKFKVVQNQYLAKIGGVEHSFLFFPRDIEYIYVDDDVKALLESPVIVVTYDPGSAISENLAEAQYYFEYQLSDEKVIQRALTNAEGTSLLQKTCADATAASPVVLLEQSDVSSISAKDNCITISALDPYDLYQQSERVIYTLLGVME